MITKAEAIAYIKQCWDGFDGCRTCGWKGLWAEYHLDGDVPEKDVARGSVVLGCQSDENDGDHDGIVIYLPAQHRIADNSEGPRT